MKFSSSERTNQLESLSFNPGPGYYDFATPVSKMSPGAKSTKSVVKFPFGQCSSRFEQTLSKDNNDLGPGFYYAKVERQPKPQVREAKEQFSRKIMTIPSIPSAKQVMGYAEREDGYLVPLDALMAKKEKEAGPGTYSISENIIRKKVKSFSISRGAEVPRFAYEKKENNKADRIVLGNYSLPKQERSINETPTRLREMRMKQSPSPPPRSFIKPAPLKTEESPSPWQYYNEKASSSFKIICKPPQYQNFGSAAKRFSDATTVEVEESPGPGSYNLPKNSGLKDTFIRVEPFAREDFRFRTREPEQLPGPGAYEKEYVPKVLNETSSSNVLEFAASFGSSAGRFVADKAILEQPGPGSYDPYKSPKKARKRRVRPTVTSLRSASEAESLLQFSRELSQSRDLDMDGRSKGAITVKHEMPANKGSPMFMSPGRATPEDDKIRSLSPGPGSYDPKFVKIGAKPAFTKKRTTFAKSPKHVEVKIEEYQKTIGPGFYDYDLDMVKTKTNYTPKISPILVSYGGILAK